MSRPTDHDDHELEEFLRQSPSALGELYRRLPQPQPEPALDQRILEQARLALATYAATAPTTSARARPRRYARWPIALGSAASVVFAAALALHFGVQEWQTPSPAPAVGTSSTAGEVVHIRSSDRPDAGNVTAQSAPPPANTPVVSAPAASSPTAVTARRASPSAAAVPATAAALASPPPPMPSEPTPQPSPSRAEANAAPPLQTLQSDAAKPAQANAESGSVTNVSDAAADLAAAKKSTATETNKSQDKLRKDERDAVERKLDIATGRDAALRARAAEAAQAAAVATSPASSAAPATAAKAAPIENADTWIASIRAQLQAGDREQARRELQRFRQSYPNYALTPELRALLP